ncbi:MAG: L,D-transpeptidase family protein [Lachnospiraceae bacterium]|nr:L,D-transpeptidase family protein [Lachnospiraceae bacterium]
MSRNKKVSNSRNIILAVLIVLAAILIIVFLIFGKYFKTHFFPKTTVNSVDVSLMTAEDLRSELQNKADEYLLTITDRNGNKYHITGLDIDYTYNPIGEEESLLDAQSSYAWPIEIFKSHENDISETLTFDENKLADVVAALDCFSDENMVEPENAYLAETDTGYEIVSETQGSYLIYENAYAEILNAVNEGATELTLSDSDYKAAEITSDDANLNSCLTTINNYLNTEITYDLGDETEVLDAETIKEWVEIDTENNTVSLNEDMVASYAQYLASKYNTYADEREFTTHTGDTITIGGGDYGWIVDKSGEYETLLSELAEGTVTTREIVYQQRALYKGSDDIGDTYIEIDYTKQHLYYYEDGELVIDDDIVSGNLSKNNGSPDGIFKIVYKQSPAVLKGEDYESDVQYFMPFAYNVGIHDASWRSKFGGSEYLTSGSHGCINMDESTVKKLYELVDVGTPVIAYYTKAVELTSENAKISNAYSYVEPEEDEEESSTTTTTTSSTSNETTAEDDTAVANE